MVADKVTQEVRALEGLDLEALRAQWRRRYGAPPRMRSADLVRYQLAWRIQVEAFGGLDAQTRRRLRTPNAQPADALSVGAFLTREWQGVKQTVVVVDGGFLHAGTVYTSLSQVARAITGARWNGPRFFGLRADPAS